VVIVAASCTLVADHPSMAFTATAWAAASMAADSAVAASMRQVAAAVVVKTVGEYNEG
jgi:hypothetical protein